MDLDVYSLWESMDAIVDYLEKTKSPILQKAIKAIECFVQYEPRPEIYGVAAAFYGEDCMNEVLELLQSITKAKKEVKF